MGNLTTKFAGLEAQLETQHLEVIDNLEAILNRLDAVNVALDIITNNNATNTKLILAAIGQNSPCAPCPTPPIVIPPVDATPHPIDADKCKRVQAFLHTMAEVFTVLDVASSVGIGFNPSLITDAFNQVIATLGNGDETPVISFPEAVQLVGDLVSYVATNILVGGTLNGYFSPLVFDLQDALYSSSTPADAQSAYNGEIDGDTASFIFNGKMICEKRMISNAPIIFKLKLDELQDNELVFIPNNEGAVSPNTGLAVIYDSGKRKEVFGKSFHDPFETKCT